MENIPVGPNIEQYLQPIICQNCYVKGYKYSTEWRKREFSSGGSFVKYFLYEVAIPAPKFQIATPIM